MPLNDLEKATAILCAVSSASGVTERDIKSNRRGNNVIPSRHLACWMMRHYTGLSYPDIGQIIGGRDHTTIMHAVKQWDLRRCDRQFADLESTAMRLADVKDELAMVE